VTFTHSCLTPRPASGRRRRIERDRCASELISVRPQSSLRRSITAFDLSIGTSSLAKLCATASLCTSPRRLRRLALALGVEVLEAASAFPPGVAEAEARACRYVLENAGVTCRRLVDEISAAQALLQISDGAIVDVGGGSTGVGVVVNNELMSLTDAPGGGHHLDLIVAGALRIPIYEAERRKRAGEPGLSSILRPGVERIANSIGKQIAPRTVETVHLVGGAVRVSDAPEIIGRYLGLRAVGYPHSELVTPFGIAMS
jgi:ethanolamine utilization protein EutJ